MMAENKRKIRKKGPERKWIDISMTLQSGMIHWPGDPAVKIGRKLSMEKGSLANVSVISMGSHTGTHMDAPAHYIKHGKGIDKLAFDSVIGPARVLGIQDQRSVTRKELEKMEILAGERVLFKTKNSSVRKGNKFRKDFVYISKEAAQYLALKKIKLVGIDYLSVGGFYRDGIGTHIALLRAGIAVIEGLDLSRIVPGNYDLICLPLKILNSDGAPARALIRAGN
jgi:arylformamidase